MRRLVAALRVGATLLVGVGAMAALMVWLAGGFHEKIGPKNARPLPPPAAGLPTIAVEARLVPAFWEAVGTVAAEHETAVASLLLGRVRAVEVSAGDEVKVGQPIGVRLDALGLQCEGEVAEIVPQSSRAARST